MATAATQDAENDAASTTNHEEDAETANQSQLRNRRIIDSETSSSSDDGDDGPSPPQQQPIPAVPSLPRPNVTPQRHSDVPQNQTMSLTSQSALMQANMQQQTTSTATNQIQAPHAQQSDLATQQRRVTQEATEPGLSPAVANPDVTSSATNAMSLVSPAASAPNQTVPPSADELPLVSPAVAAPVSIPPLVAALPSSSIDTAKQQQHLPNAPQTQQPPPEPAPSDPVTQSRAPLSAKSRSEERTSTVQDMPVPVSNTETVIQMTDNGNNIPFIFIIRFESVTNHFVLDSSNNGLNNSSLAAIPTVVSGALENLFSAVRLARTMPEDASDMVYGNTAPDRINLSADIDVGDHDHHLAGVFDCLREAQFWQAKSAVYSSATIAAFVRTYRHWCLMIDGLRKTGLTEGDAKIRADEHIKSVIQDMLEEEAFEVTMREAEAARRLRNLRNARRRGANIWLIVELFGGDWILRVPGVNWAPIYMLSAQNMAQLVRLMQERGITALEQVPERSLIQAVDGGQRISSASQITELPPTPSTSSAPLLPLRQPQVTQAETPQSTRLATMSSARTLGTQPRACQATSTSSGKRNASQPDSSNKRTRQQ